MILSAGGHHTCGLARHLVYELRPYCWGSNYYGAVGNPAGGPAALQPTAVQTDAAFSQIHAGGYLSCGLSKVPPMGELRLYCWGENFFGGVGDGTTNDRYTPVVVSGSI